MTGWQLVWHFPVASTPAPWHRTQYKTGSRRLSGQCHTLGTIFKIELDRLKRCQTLSIAAHQKLYEDALLGSLRESKTPRATTRLATRKGTVPASGLASQWRSLWHVLHDRERLRSAMGALCEAAMIPTTEFDRLVSCRSDGRARPGRTHGKNGGETRPERPSIFSRLTRYGGGTPDGTTGRSLFPLLLLADLGRQGRPLQGPAAALSRAVRRGLG